MKLVEIENIEEWEKIKKEAGGSSDILIFKYSPICSISSSVEHDFNIWLSGLSDNTPIKFIKIDVIDSRPLSQFIAGELEIKHQSPQLIWLSKKGAVKWHASHYDINPADLTSLLKN